MPENYFDGATVDRLNACRARAEAVRDARLFFDFPAAMSIAGLERRLAGSAAAVFRHWQASVEAMSDRPAGKKKGRPESRPKVSQSQVETVSRPPRCRGLRGVRWN